MFRCKECGLEYNIKPDYCDCGNDIFEEVAGSNHINTNTQVQGPQVQHQEKFSRRTFEEQYPELVKLKQSFDPISTVVFGICLILAIVVLFFVGNPEEKPAEQNIKTQKQETQVVQNIPSIDTLWNSSTVGIINNEKTLAAKYAGKNANVQTTKLVQTVPQPAPVQQPIAPVVQPQTKPQQSVTAKSQPAPAKTQQPPKQNNIITNLFNKNTTTQPNQAAKPTAQAKPNTATVNKTAKTTTSSQVKPNIPKTTQSIASGTTSSSVKTHNTGTNYSNSSVISNNKPQASTTTNKTNSQKTVNTAAATATAKNSAQNSTLRPKAQIDTQALQKELASYKIGLQNTLGRKIDFANVVGDGDCVVSFKVSSAGQLTNRSFSKQSSNVTLNDAVYSAIMSTPKYNAPPSGYKGETMSFSVRFYNGNIGVSLK
jgi:hypothetical protein